MVIDLNIEKKYIDFWLSRGEMPPDIGEYRHQYPGFDIAVFHSGSGNVKALTAELLRVNCNTNSQ